MIDEILNEGFMVSSLRISVDTLLIITYHDFIFLPALALYRVLIRPHVKFVLHQRAVSLDTLSR